jgi:hypothetical protein
VLSFASLWYVWFGSPAFFFYGCRISSPTNTSNNTLYFLALGFALSGSLPPLPFTFSFFVLGVIEKERTRLAYYWYWGVGQMSNMQACKASVWGLEVKLLLYM